MKTYFRYLILFLLFSSAGLSQKDLPEYARKQIESNEKARAETIANLESESKKHLPELLKQFDLVKVQGNNSGWYHNKKQIKKDQSRLETPVSVNGHIFLKAFLLGDNFLLATRIRLKVKNMLVESNPLVEGGPYIKRKTVNGKKSETLFHFSWKTATGFEDRAMRIISTIAETKEGDKVTVVFIGEKENTEIVLTQDNIKAIKESWNLSRYILVKNKEYESFVTFPNQITFLFPKQPLTKDDMKGVNND